MTGQPAPAMIVQGVAQHLAVGHLGVDAVHGERRVRHGDFPAGAAEGIAGHLQQFARPVADAHLVGVDAEAFRDGGAQVFALHGRVAVERELRRFGDDVPAHLAGQIIIGLIGVDDDVGVDGLHFVFFQVRQTGADRKISHWEPPSPFPAEQPVTSCCFPCACGWRWHGRAGLRPRPC